MKEKERRGEVVGHMQEEHSVAKEEHSLVEPSLELLEDKMEEMVGAELPLDLWEEIGKHVVRLIDLVSLRSVCKISRLALPSLFPLKVPPPPCCDMEFRNRPFFITQVYFYSVELRSGQRVLVAFQQEHEGNKVRPVVILPSGVELEYFCMPRHSFVAKAYRLGTALPPINSYEAEYDFKFGFDHSLSIKMVLISSNTDSRVDGSYARVSDVSVVAHLSTMRLALLRLGGSIVEDWGWNTSFCSNMFVDIVAYKGQLYTIDCRGTTFSMDYNSLEMKQVASRPSSICYMVSVPKLFEACGDLYLAAAPYPNLQTNDVVEVYMLSLPLKKWVKVEGFGNQALVECGCFSVSIPRDAFSVNPRSKMIMKDHFVSPSLIFSNDQKLKDGSDRGYCHIPFTTQHYPSMMEDYIHAS